MLMKSIKKGTLWFVGTTCKLVIATKENSMQDLQKIKNRTTRQSQTIQQSHFWEYTQRKQKH